MFFISNKCFTPGSTFFLFEAFSLFELPNWRFENKFDLFLQKHTKVFKTLEILKKLSKLFSASIKDVALMNKEHEKNYKVVFGLYFKIV